MTEFLEIYDGGFAEIAKYLSLDENKSGPEMIKMFLSANTSILSKKEKISFYTILSTCDKSEQGIRNLVEKAKGEDNSVEILGHLYNTYGYEWILEKKSDLKKDDKWAKLLGQEEWTFEKIKGEFKVDDVEAFVCAAIGDGVRIKMDQVNGKVYCPKKVDLLSSINKTIELIK